MVGYSKFLEGTEWREKCGSLHSCVRKFEKQLKLICLHQTYIFTEILNAWLSHIEVFQEYHNFFLFFVVSKTEKSNFSKYSNRVGSIHLLFSSHYHTPKLIIPINTCLFSSDRTCNYPAWTIYLRERNSIRWKVMKW